MLLSNLMYTDCRVEPFISVSNSSMYLYESYGLVDVIHRDDERHGNAYMKSDEEVLRYDYDRGVLITYYEPGSSMDCVWIFVYVRDRSSITMDEINDMKMLYDVHTSLEQF